MKFRCNRLGYLFIKRHAMEALSIYGSFFLLPTIAIFLFFGVDALKIWIFFPAFFVLATILVLFSLIYLPRWIALDGKKLMEAHEDPTRHPDLVVRVTGFTAYFASLSPRFRNLVVDRFLEGM